MMKFIYACSIWPITTLFIPTLYAQTLVLDPNFGAGGIWTGPVSLANHVQVLPSNDILLCGSTIDGPFDPYDALLLKLHPDGVADSLFGTDGMATVSFDNMLNEFLPFEGFSSTVVLDDGRIACAGQKSSYIYPNVGWKSVLAVFKPDGRRDSSFGNFGRLLQLYPGYSADEAGIFKYSNGDLLIWAFINPLSALDSSLLSLVRIHPDGNPDTTFGEPGSGGRAIRDLGPADPFYKSVPSARITMDPFDRVLVGGSTDVFDCSITRFNPDGSLDPGFGTGGQAVVNVGFDPTIFDMFCRPDGKVLLVGSSRLAGDPVFTIVQLNADGSKDESWGDHGVMIRDMSEYDNMLFSAALQTDGKVLALGTRITASGETETVFVRFLPNGDLDSTFSNAGVQILEIDSQSPSLQHIKIGGDHAVYVLGGTETITQHKRFLAKYLPDNYVETQSPPAQQSLHACISPNPVSAGQTLQLEWEIPDATRLQAALIDAQGRTLQNWQEEETPAGTAKKALRLRADLPSGLYRLLLTTKNASITLPVALK